MGSDELGKAVEHLYTVFARYPLRARIESCPHCQGTQKTRHLYGKSLRELTAADLEIIAFCGMTTVGDVDDFRHFLPRILEVLPSPDFPVDHEVVLGTLTYGGWTRWPTSERDAIKTYLAGLWQWARRQNPDAGPHAFCDVGTWLGAIACAEADLSGYLAEWGRDTTPEARASFARFLQDYQDAIGGTSGPGGFWDDTQDQWRQVTVWVGDRLGSGPHPKESADK